MAITLDATVGGANANTYITLADANTFIAVSYTHLTLPTSDLV